MTEQQIERIIERQRKARQMVVDLCKAKGSQGSREWIMSIPARPDYDPDIVIANSLSDIPDLVRKLREAQEVKAEPQELAADYDACMKQMDRWGIPRQSDSGELSMFGRCLLLLKKAKTLAAPQASPAAPIAFVQISENENNPSCHVCGAKLTIVSYECKSCGASTSPTEGASPAVGPTSEFFIWECQGRLNNWLCGNRMEGPERPGACLKCGSNQWLKLVSIRAEGAASPETREVARAEAEDANAEHFFGEPAGEEMREKAAWQAGKEKP